MKLEGRRKSKNIIDNRNRKPEPSIVGLAKRNADEVRFMRQKTPNKVKSDMENALRQIRTKVKTTKKQDRLK